jgi:hypothetical protein
MLVRKGKRVVALNWTAILSCAGSLVISLAIWAGLIRAVQHLVK